MSFANSRPSRPIVVQKYGGSSVADVEKLGRVADRIVATREAGNDVVVVVSAMGKTTDSLLTLAREVSRCDGKSVDPPRRELDMLVSTGERVSMALLSIAIAARGHDAISFTGSQSGILTNDRHFDARIIEVRPFRIEDELARGKIVIVAGYQGMSYRREITTLGRGGSDTTAVALAAALHAERCEIYSDVDGVYSADPRTVPDAKHLPEISAEVVQEMAEAGAKVLCAQAIEWARRNGIKIFAKSTFGDDKQFTTIVPEQTNTARTRAIVCDSKIALVAWHHRADELTHFATEHNLTIKEFVQLQSGRTALLSLLNTPHWNSMREKLCSLGAAVQEGVAQVSVVGDGFSAEHHKIFQSSSSTIQGSSFIYLGPLRMSALISEKESQACQMALHSTFVE